MASNAQLVQLWSFGKRSCFFTKSGSPPPFVVDIYERCTCLAQQTFADRMTAAQCAVDALKSAPAPLEREIPPSLAMR